MSSDCIRHFLGWDSPALDQATNWLVKTLYDSSSSCEMDFSSVVLVLPGRRAGRLLLGKLVDYCQDRSIPLIPPIIITPKELASSMLGPSGQPISWVTSRQCWIHALKTLDSEEFQTLFPKEQPDKSWPMLMASAKWIQSIASELGDAGLIFNDVPKIAEHILDDQEISRWNALHTIQREYFRQLKELNLIDERCQLVNDLYESTAQTNNFNIILVGLPQVSTKSRQAIERAKPDIQSLVFAPEDYSEKFDSFGCVITDSWLNHVPDILEERIVFPESYSSMCEQAFVELTIQATKSPEPTDSSQCVIGLADETLIDPLKRVASSLSKDPPAHVHAPIGDSIASTPPFKLLRDMQSFLNTSSLDTLGQLIRNPQIENYLQNALAKELSADQITLETPSWWISILDRIRQKHAVSKSLHLPTGVHKTDADQYSMVLNCIQSLLSTLQQEPTDRKLDEWMNAIKDVLLSVYSTDKLNPDNKQDQSHIEGLRVFGSIINDFADSPMNACTDSVPATEAISLILEHAAEHHRIDELDASSIEAIGWLELALDPSPLCVVIGLSESCVPGSITHDPILPGALRNQLSMITNNDRLARDIYLISLINASRTAVFMSARIGDQNEPVTPSRILLRATREQLAKRVERFVEPTSHDSRRSIGKRVRPGSQDLFRNVLTIPEEYIAPDTMSVTDFDSYLRSPAQWFLEKYLKLREIDTEARELSPAHIGSLIHSVLESFSNDSSMKDLVECKQIQDALLQLLDESAARDFGQSPASTIKIQLQLLQQRVLWFAHGQAQRRREGWSIIHTEWSPEDSSSSSLKVDNQPVKLKGKIDRIDQHADGRIAIIDYKSGKITDARKAHQNTSGWIKLQLPLYRILAQELLNNQQPVLGYSGIPSSESESVWSFSNWSNEELNSADEVAAYIIRELRQFKPGDHIPIGKHPSTEGTFGFLNGQRFNSGGLSISPEEDTQDSEAASI